MGSLPFDTYEVVKLLKERGFSEEQASGISEALQHLDLSHLATKGDIQRLDNKIDQLRAEVRTTLRELELRMTIKLGGLIVVGVGALAALKVFG